MYTVFVFLVGFFLGVALYRLYVRWRIFLWLKKHHPFHKEENFGAFFPRFSFLLEKLHREVEEKEEALHIYQDMVNSLEDAIIQLPVPVIFVDERGRVFRVNESAGEWFALTKPVRKDQTVFVWMLSTNPDWQDFTRDMIRTPEKIGQISRSIEDLVHPEHRVKCVVMPWIHEHLRFYIMVLFDETLLAHHERYKSEVLDLIIHQIRTPLTALNGAMELLSTKKEFDTKGRQIIVRNVKKLMDFLKKLELLYELQSPIARPFEVVDLAEIVKRVVQDLQVVYQDKKVQVILDVEPVKFHGDPMLLSILFENLLDNAFKFSPENGSILVSFVKTEKGLDVGIEDEGPGIPLKEIPHVFERFYRGDYAKTRNIPGDGLGLSIVKHITIMHGIHIRIKPASQGTHIFMTFPREKLQTDSN